MKNIFSMSSFGFDRQFFGETIENVARNLFHLELLSNLAQSEFPQLHR